MDEDKKLTLSTEDFGFIQKLVLERSAIVLRPEKAYLVEARLVPLARREGFDTMAELIANVRRRNPHDGLVKKTVEAMTTNETSFFRDLHPFQALKSTLIPQLLEQRKGQKSLNFWCAASSTGQEPYTICMILRENFPEVVSSWKIDFVASDLSSEVVDRAKEGLYTQLEVNRGLPAPLLVRYFTKEDSEWRIKEEIRNMVDFRIINLVESWPPMPQLDIVFIRNVLIYFDVETKREILANIRKRMRPGALLFLGSAETTLNIDDQFERCTCDKATFYRLKGA